MAPTATKTTTARKATATKRTTPAKPKPGAYAAGTLQQVPPGELLIERNIREAKPSAELVASVADHGVLEPITAVLNADGKLVVRFGHRRAIAAVEAARATVPVYIAGDDDTAQDAEVDRIVRQRDENTHRAGLTAADEVAVYEQLAAFGLSADQVATRTRVKRDVVDTALKVSGSKIARAAAVKYDALTLDQVATVAEFEHDAEVVKRLVVAAVERPEQFAHVAQAARDDVLLENSRQMLLADLGQEQMLVISAPNYNDKAERLSSLSVKGDGKAISQDAHKTCPGHVAWLTTAWQWVDTDGAPVTKVDQVAGHRNVQTYVANYGCRDPKKHGHKPRYGSSSTSKPAAADMSDAEREKAKAARKLVIDNNKAWDSAEVVRREWLTEFAQRKTPPKGAAAFIAQAIGCDPSLFHDAKSTYAPLLGVAEGGYQTSPAGDAAAKATEARALQIAVVMVVGGYEAALDRMDWRRDGKCSPAGRYLRFLESAGYGLSDVEKFAVSSKTVA